VGARGVHVSEGSLTRVADGPTVRSPSHTPPHVGQGVALWLGVYSTVVSTAVALLTLYAEVYLRDHKIR
jgi:hypothetical protein